MENKKKAIVGSVLLLLTIILVISSFPHAQASPYKVEIRIRGTNGLRFSGSYGDLGGQTSVEGTVPKTYTLKDPEGDIVSVVMQKQEETGRLTVELVKDGKVVKSGTTTARYGVVSVSHNFGAGAGAGAGAGLLAGFGFVIVVWFIVALLLCIWVYKDAEARGKNGILWLLIVLITGIIGVIVWLIVRPEKGRKRGG